MTWRRSLDEDRFDREWLPDPMPDPEDDLDQYLWVSDLVTRNPPEEPDGDR